MRLVLSGLVCATLFAGCSGHQTAIKLPPLLAFIEQADGVDVFEGLPHHSFEAELLAQEIARANTIEFDGHRFYAQTIPVSDDLIRDLRRVAADSTLYTPVDEYVVSECGGFHPDWRLRWNRNGESRDLLLCFGCHEMKAYANGEFLIHCRVSDPSLFAQLLKPLRQNRPASPHTEL